MSITRRRHVATTDGDTSADRARRTRPWCRIGHGALIVAAGTAALSLAGPFALRPFVDVAHAAGTAGEIPVAFVLDFGGSSSSEVVGCVNVPSTSTKYQALSAFAQQQGLAQPVYANSGLLCSINGVPSTGCGQIVNGRYIYWSYFTGSGNSWVYSNTGAFSTVGTDDVEGWRFQNPGAGNPSDPAPRHTARYASICGSGTGTQATHPAGGGGGGGGGAGGSRPIRGRHAVTPSAAAVAGAVAVPSSTTTSTPGSTTTSTYPPDTPTSLPAINIPADPEVGLANAKHSEKGSSGPGPDPLIIGGLLIAALAVAGYTRWRKRPHAP